jgi:hypothetical protein
MASARINDALAAAAGGDRRAGRKALLALLRLTPVEVLRYLRASRLAERVWPRLRARMAGSF